MNLKQEVTFVDDSKFSEEFGKRVEVSATGFRRRKMPDVTEEFEGNLIQSCYNGGDRF